jgi:hypothetical protein
MGKTNLGFEKLGQYQWSMEDAASQTGLWDELQAQKH